MSTARVIARATTEIPNEPRFGGGTREEIATITEYPDAGVVAIEVEHYDGARVVELDLASWHAFRAAIIADSTP